MGEFQITPVESAAHAQAARAILSEYARSLAHHVCLVDFQRELDALPGQFAPPEGGLFLAWQGGGLAGCAALRRLDAGIGEMKRLYVRPAYRRRGLGRRLAQAVISLARRRGYARLRLDTMPDMRAAIALYGSLGFRRLEPPPGPTDGRPFWMELEL
jgi:ribosomal protein S18 acetylase RimI-like enzyme